MQAEARGKMKLIRFAPNRVGRVYAGGAEIDRLQGVEAPADGGCPEEWIASTVEAQGPRRPGEGVSRVLLPDGGSVPFDRLLGEEAEEILGPAHVARFGKAPGFLTKLLDSAIRLPVQAHPDRAAAKRLFGSEYGKTEAWIVIGGRKIDGEEPYLLMGFNESFDYEVFRREALAGVMERTVGMMHRCPVVPGEVYLITGGLPHAIGSGVFVQEIMEPTDYVIQPELHCGGTRLDERARWGGLDPEKALGVFHCEALPEAELLRRVRRPWCCRSRPARFSGSCWTAGRPASSVRSSSGSTAAGRARRSSAASWPGPFSAGRRSSRRAASALRLHRGRPSRLPLRRGRCSKGRRKSCLRCLPPCICGNDGIW